MQEVKTDVYKALKGLADNVSSGYPKDWATFPAIAYSLEDNSEYVTLMDGSEAASSIRIRIDIWDKKSTTDISISVSDTMKKLGFIRTNCGDVQDASGLKHTLMRFNKKIV